MVERYIGLMSGTSLDGVDAALLEYAADGAFHFVQASYLAYPEILRTRLLALHAPSAQTLHETNLLGVELARIYARCVQQLLADAGLGAQEIRAIGCHGQTILHNPGAGYSLQLNQPALLVELTGISVITDFRSRDIAAGGQGAPLVPAFHHEAFRHSGEHRVILNIGGIANITDLPPAGTIRGFDTGPGNMLMDAWIQEKRGLAYDADAAWAKHGKILPALLERLLHHDFLALAPPKSCGREQFNLAWLQTRLEGNENPADVQATLTEFTVRTITDAILRECGTPDRLIVCGGGARNPLLMTGLHNAFPRAENSAAHGYPADWLEAIAFAWLARRTVHGQVGNLPAVTGARVPRILGAIYPR